MLFHVLPYGSRVPGSGRNEIFLIVDNWNDYSFVTSFGLIAFDQNGVRHNLTGVRIGFVGQTADVSTHQKLMPEFRSLGQEFFSLGMDVEYYKYLYSQFDSDWRKEFLECIRDVVWNDSILEVANGEDVFQKSLLRSISVSKIRDQFVSVLRGEVLLTDFEFGFCLPPSEEMAGFDLKFSVSANSTPSTNMHALIGRNGVGKTTLLNAMVNAIADKASTDARFYTEGLLDRIDIDEMYFSKLVSVAFSVFDPFDLPQEGDGNRYSYIGLTDYSADDGAIIKSKYQIFDEFADGLKSCFQDESRKNRWIQAVETLQSDKNFSDMNLLNLVNLNGDDLKRQARNIMNRMSSGHSVVIFTITLLVERIEEKTLVLFDEPESHLHPPLLSALMRTLIQLLHTRNAVAIVATHSPVVLQEIPKSCVWKVFRSKLASEKMRPDTETFGENVGILTREVFGLEVERSGFHTVLSDAVARGGAFEEVIARLGGSLGNEARGILRAMVVNRDGT